METSKPWYKSVKVYVFSLIFVVVTIGLILLVVLGKLPCTVELVGAYVGGVVALACGLFVGRGLGSVGRGISDVSEVVALVAAAVADQGDDGPPEPEDDPGEG